MQFKLMTILLLLLPLNGLTKSFYWKIDNNCFIISVEDLDEIIATKVEHDDLPEIKANHFKDSILVVNSFDNPYNSDFLNLSYLSDQDLFVFLVETECIPRIINERSNQNTIIKKKIGRVNSPLGCSIYQLNFITKKKKNIVFSETITIGLCD